MANTSARMLRLLSLLQSHRDWSGQELAERLEVSPRTVRRDVDRLRELGYPVDATRGVDGGYRLAPGASMPPLVLEDDEAVALVVALHASATMAISGTADASIDTLAKVVQVLPPRLRRRAEDVARMTVTAEWSTTVETVDPLVLTTLASSARNVERVEFVYRDRAGVVGDRLVEPMRLVMLGRRWYLVAYDVNRLDWRTFRVDRIERPRSTGRVFQPKPLPIDDAAEYVRSSIQGAARALEIEVDLELPATSVGDRFAHWSTVTPLGPARCRMTISTDDFDWPTMMLASLGADFEVIAPDAFRDHLAAVGRRFTRSTAPPPAPGTETKARRAKRSA